MTAPKRLPEMSRKPACKYRWNTRRNLPPLRLMLISGSDPPRISNSMRNFAGEFQARDGIVDELNLEGHDDHLRL